MVLFQNSVIDKYLKSLDRTELAEFYSKFRAYFHNPAVQENIRGSKEEQFQEGFLINLFVNILGYTIHPTPYYNLITENKNVKDSKKADGAIKIGDKIRVVIELKGTDTTDLNKIESQAFGYKNNQPECVYVITSNFEKLRFYIDNAIEYEEFNLFTLTEKQFELLYLCLAYKNIEKGLPKKIKDESLSHEDKITNRLYHDYSLFKRQLYEELVMKNPHYDALTLFKKSQKLLDRFLFLFFAEDRQLLPPNSVRLILTDWRELQERDVQIPLYDRYKKYFEYLNTGYKGKRYDVFAYNGGLFKPDAILDSVTIDDELLYAHTLKLSDYDFSSEVDVNILGHIFENSLNELDEIKAQLEGQIVDKTKTKRKKEGVFYTPKYITKYIVDNTVGKLCEEKKAELGIVEEDYYTDRKRQKKTIQGLAEKLNAYRNWLLQITICDPACGSGAFLNQALNFLIDEHRLIDEMQAKLFGDALVLSDIENTILENNLFGVDLNDESVEIAKLSLWLRTAQPNRKLNDLSNNIKCGNSLIDDPAVAGDKAFNWEKEFPQVFGYKEEPQIIVAKIDETPDYLQLIKEQSLEAKAKADQAIELSKNAAELSKQAAELSVKVCEYAVKLEAVSEPEAMYGLRKGGFDVVIGNPPYGVNFNEIEKKYLYDFDSLVPDYEIYVYFISLYKKLLKSNSMMSYIFPNTFLSNLFGKKYRDALFNNANVYQLVDLSNDNTFVDAAVRTCILFLRNNKDEYSTELFKVVDKDFSLLNTYTKDSIVKETENILSLFSQNPVEKLVIQKIQKNKPLKKFYEVSQGLIPYDKYRGHDEFTIKNRIWHSNFQKDDTFRKELKGGDINRYNIQWNGNLWISYGEWLAAPRKIKFFKSERILIREIISGTMFCGYTRDEFYNTPSAINVINESNILNLKYSLSLLNSRLLGWFLNKTSPKANKGLFPKILVNDVKNLPLVDASQKNQQLFIEKAELMLSLNKELQVASQKFQRAIQRDFDVEDVSTKLKNWYSLTFKEFITELSKKKIKLNKKDEYEWEDLFLQEQAKAVALKTQIDNTDNEIDQMVYALYELTDEEIKIVEEL